MKMKYLQLTIFLLFYVKLCGIERLTNDSENKEILDLF